MEGEVEIESTFGQDDPVPFTRNPEVRRHSPLIQEPLLLATRAGRRRPQDRTKQTPQTPPSVPSNATSSAGPSSSSGGDQQGSQDPPSSSRPRPRGLKREGAFHEISRPYWHVGSGYEPPEVRGQDAAMLPENQVWQTGWGPVPHVSHVAARYGGPCTTSQVLRYLNEQFRFNRPAYYMALDILFPQPPSSPAPGAEPKFSRTWDTTTWRRENPDWEGGIVSANKRVRRRKATVWSDRARAQNGDASSGSRSATEVTDEEQRAIHDILTNELPQSSATAPSHHKPPPPPSTAASSRSSSSRKRTRDEDEDADIASVSGVASDAPERPTVRRRLDDQPPRAPPSPSSTRSRGTRPDVATRRRERLMRILEAHRGPAIRLDLRKLLPRPSRTVAPLRSRVRSESRDIGKPPTAEFVEGSSRAHQASPSPSRKRSRDAESNGVDVAVEGRPKDGAGKRKNKRSKKQ
ncbi:hypothetical protein C8Q74DRAFT_202136 [Fomes fomentarius]|nr:hypothetical protein C8Q74DRAFT_202136 [Fomes fomentarius]